MENDFILPLEKEGFIEQLKDIVDKAEDLLSEDAAEGERNGDQGVSPKHGEADGTAGTEVRPELPLSLKCLRSFSFLLTLRLL